MKKAMTKTDAAEKVRLSLDAELIADLETDGHTIKGGQSGGGASIRPTASAGTIAIQGTGGTPELKGGC